MIGTNHERVPRRGRADPQGIGVLDETGFLKKGTKSVGVGRQYSGTAGRIENCQIAVLLGYTSTRGHVLFDRRLYLPESWCNDPVRMQRTQLPEHVSFQTKPELSNVPVAKIVPLSASGDVDAELAALAAEGKLRLGEGPLPRSFWSSPAPRVSKKDVLRVLRAERDER